MEALYMKLYEKYSKLKASKDSPFDQINQEQEVKFVEYVSAAENLINHLRDENNRLSAKIDELQKEVVSVRSAKDEQFNSFQEQLLEENQRNLQLSLELENLRNLQLEKMSSTNRSGHPPKQNSDTNGCSPVSRPETYGSPMRITRKRARLFEETSPTTSTPTNGQQWVRREPSTDNSKRGHCVPACCQDTIVNGGICKCMFQGLFEHLIGMKVSVADQPEGKGIRAVHQSSGYSFSLILINKTGSEEAELLYNVTSLGTFVSVAPEWMSEVIIFSISMFPRFFERVSRIIKPH